MANVETVQSSSPLVFASSATQEEATKIVTSVTITQQQTTSTSVAAACPPPAPVQVQEQQVKTQSSQLPPLYEFETKNRTPTKYVYLGKLPYNNGRTVTSSQQSTRGGISSSRYNLHNPRQQQQALQSSSQHPQQQKQQQQQGLPKVPAPEGYVADGVIHFNISRTPYGQFSEVYQVFKAKKEVALPVAASVNGDVQQVQQLEAAPVAPASAAPVQINVQIHQVPNSTVAGSVRQAAVPQQCVPATRHHRSGRFQQVINDYNGTIGHRGRTSVYGIDIDFDSLFGHNNSANGVENGANEVRVESGEVTVEAPKKREHRHRRDGKRSSKREQVVSAVAVDVETVHVPALASEQVNQQEFVSVQQQAEALLA